MMKEVQSQLLQELQKGNICSITSYSKKYRQLSQADIIQSFIAVFKKDMNQNYDLLCHVAIVNDRDTRIQNERYSNIQRGVLVEKVKSLTTYEFKREHIKQLKVLAIFPNNMLVSQVENSLEFPSFGKTKEYVNKFVVLPKLIVENIAMAKNKSKKEEKPQKKDAKSVDTNKKDTKTKTEVDSKKAPKKTDSKSSMESEPKVPVQAKKISSKEQSQPAPVLTHYQSQRQKVEEEAVNKEKEKPSRKLVIESEEEYYNPSDIIKQLNGKNEHLETDNSGKKQNEKMDVESDNGRKASVKQFIVGDEEDDDDEIFAKMEEAAKIKPENKSNPSSNPTCPKKQNPVEPPKKVQPPKAVSKAPAAKVAPPATKNSSLMGWIKVNK